MILKSINIFSQNVCKNNLLTNTILEAQKKFNIIFIQELPWLFIRSISSSVRHGSHRGGSPQNGLRDEQTCGMTLASAHVLYRLSATWLQLQIMGRSPRWE